MGRSIVASIKTKPSYKRTGFTIAKLEQALEAGYLLSAREPGDKMKKSFAPSSIGYGKGTCPRFWHIAFGGAWFEETPDAVGVATMAHGTAAHERIQEALEKAGVTVAVTGKRTREDSDSGRQEHEAKLDDPPIFGYIDLILEIDGERVVGEIKTTSSDIWRWRATYNKPAPYHLYQILIYMHITGLDHGFLMYEERDTFQIAIIEIRMDETNKKVLDDALEWMRAVHKNFTDGGEIPKAPWTKKNKACRECPVFNKCWNIGLADDDENRLPIGSDKIGAMEVYNPPTGEARA